MARNTILTQTGAEVQSDLDKIEGAKIEGGTITIGGVSITPATAAELTRVDNKATDALSNSSTAAQMASSAQIDAANALRLANSIPVVKGDGEHAARQEGEDSTNHPYAKGARSIALGRRTVALGDNSHTEGNSSNVAPASVTAATDNEVIKQAWNTSKFSLAKGQNAHTEGNNTLALANHTHAEGNQTVAEGQQSHTEGYLTETKNQSEHAEGRANKSNKASDTFGNAGNTIHSVGIGANAGNRKNAFEIMQSGDAFLLGVGGYDGTNPGDADALAQVLASKQDTLVSGQNIKTVNGENILGSGNIVAGDPNAVKYTEQTLTDAQKTQARTNIGAGTVNSYEVQNVSPADQYVSTELRSLLAVAPKMVVRKTSVFDAETFETSSSSNIYISHPLMNYSGAEVVLMSYAKKNQHRIARDNEEGNSITKSKKGFCIATMVEDVDGDPSMIKEYFTFSPVTPEQELFDFLEQNTFGAGQGTPFVARSRRYGIALRIPNPQYDGPASWNKNNTYRGVPESLYSDILEVYIGCNFERDDDTDEVIHWDWGIGIK